MGCITITINHSGSGNNAIIGFTATDGIRTLTGDRAWGWGGYGTPTDEEYKIIVTPYILNWFGQTELCPGTPNGGNGSISGLLPLLIVGAIAYLVMKGNK